MALEDLDNLALRPLAHQGGNDLVELVPVLEPNAVVTEVRIIDESGLSMACATRSKIDGVLAASATYRPSFVPQTFGGATKRKLFLIRCGITPSRS